MLGSKKNARRSDDTMDDDSDEKDTKRKSRNLSEKKRRDQFNLLVNELSSMVSTGGRKMDKSTVLKATISFLRNHNEIALRSRIHEIQEDWKPSFLTNEEFTHLVLEAVDGFIVVFSTSGQIFYISESITSLLGYLPNELLSKTIYDLVWEEEHSSLYNGLFNPVEEKGQVCFSCHLRRGGATSKESCTYELVHFVGYIRPDADTVQENRYNDYSGEVDARLVFVGIGRLQTPQLIREMCLVDSNKSEFTSRHSLEWKFLFLDHRAPPIIGYLPFELLGTSGYDYYHVDDLEKVVSCHEALMQKGEGMSCYYRFLTKGQQWIWLQTRFYITYHQWNSKPEFIVCTHKVVSYVDVLKHNRKENGLEILTTKNSPPSATSSASATWGSKNTKRRHSQEELPSDCTSMSADSPTSRLSAGPLQQQQQPMRPSAVGQNISTGTSNHSSEQIPLIQPKQQQQQQQLQGQLSVPQPPPASEKLKQLPPPFVEPIHSTSYVANLPVQPVVGNFSPSSILTHLPPVEMTPAQSQLQADLQRKHAELQALIGQQQAELRRVSEQLLMARLGLLPANVAPEQMTSSTSSTGLQHPQYISHCQYSTNLVSSTVTGATAAATAGTSAGTSSSPGMQLQVQQPVPNLGSRRVSSSSMPPSAVDATPAVARVGLQVQTLGVPVPCTGVPIAVPVPLNMPVSEDVSNADEVLTPLVPVSVHHSAHSTMPSNHQRTMLYQPPDSNSPLK